MTDSKLLKVDEVAELIGVSRSLRVPRHPQAQRGAHGIGALRGARQGQPRIPGAEVFRRSRRALQRRGGGLDARVQRREEGNVVRPMLVPRLHGLAHSDDQARVLNALRGPALGEGVHPQEGRCPEHDHGGFLRALRG